MAKNPRPLTNKSPKPPRTDGDGNHIQNKILLGLSSKECDLLFPKLAPAGFGRGRNGSLQLARKVLLSTVAIKIEQLTRFTLKRRTLRRS